MISSFLLQFPGDRLRLKLFSLWRTHYIDKIPWVYIELFWVDERCVPPTDKESNYGLAKINLLDFVPLKESSIHRIIGEADPVTESLRYSELVINSLPVKDEVPIFDFIILGIGEDGHTSSIFPGQDYLLTYNLPYAPSENPQTKQKRVSLTGLPIIKAENTLFFVSGESKKQLLIKYSEAMAPVIFLRAIF